jgi:hypothetical protein
MKGNSLINIIPSESAGDHEVNDFLSLILINQWLNNFLLLQHSCQDDKSDNDLRTPQQIFLGTDNFTLYRPSLTPLKLPYFEFDKEQKRPPF